MLKKDHTWKNLDLMADSSNFSLLSCTKSPRQLCSSIFHISGSRMRVGVKGLPDSESAWSPTSTLDCRLFSKLSHTFSTKSSRPLSHSRQKKQLYCGKVGLGIVSSLVSETKLTNEIIGKFQRKNIIFGSQVKNGILKFSKNNHESCLKSNSLPKNYVFSLPSESKFPKPEVKIIDDVTWESKGLRSTVTSLPDSSMPSSLINSKLNSTLGINDLSVEDASKAPRLPLVTNRRLQVDDSLKVKSSSLPISVDFSNGYICSLSAKEIELSEDYTCIISHGPNPKRTHIFGDCILECCNNDLGEFRKKEEPAFRSSQVPKLSVESGPRLFDSLVSFCYSCNEKLNKGEDVYTYRGEKAFCSFDCRSEAILAEEEMEKACTNSEESSPNSSYHDPFLVGLHMSK